MPIETKPLGPSDLDELAPLFDAYRVFYEQQSDMERARKFMHERLTKGDSCLIGAFSTGRMVGFTQLYPSFSSVATCPKWILNDMFVAPDCRKMGVAKHLLDHAATVARESGAASMVLATKSDNLTAQRVYEANGWVQENVFIYYNLAVA